MADVIRDVIIRIGIEQKPFKAVTPDLSAYGAVGSRTLSSPVSKPSSDPRVKELLGQVKQIDEYISAVGNGKSGGNSEIVDKLQKEREQIQKEIQDLSGLAGAEVKTAQQRVAARDWSAEKFKQIQLKERLASYKRGKAEDDEAARAKAAEDAAKRIVKARRDEVAADQHRQTQINTAVEAVRSSGEGLFRTLRGGALVFSDTSEGYEKLLENIRYVQGAWDVFSGTLQMGKGIMRAWNVVQMAATEAGGAYALTLNLITGAKIRLAAASATAATAVRAFTSLMGGPVVATAVAAVAIFGATTYAIGEIGTQAKETEKDIDVLTSRANQMHESLRQFQGMQLGLQLQGELANNPLATMDEKLASVNARLQDTQNALSAIAAHNANAAAQNAGKGVGRSKEELEQAEKILQVQEQLQKSLIDLHKQKFELLKNEQDLLQQNLQKQQQIAQTAKAAADQERSKVESIQEQVGRLNELERLQLQRVIEKKKAGGTLEAGDLRTLEQFGGQLTKETVSKAYADKGKDFAEQLSLAFTGKNLTGRGSDLADKEDRASEERSSLLKQRREVSERNNELQKQMLEESLKREQATEKLFNEILAVMQQIRRMQEQQAQDIHRGDVGRFPLK